MKGWFGRQFNHFKNNRDRWYIINHYNNNHYCNHCSYRTGNRDDPIHRPIIGIVMGIIQCCFESREISLDRGIIIIITMAHLKIVKGYRAIIHQKTCGPKHHFPASIFRIQRVFFFKQLRLGSDEHSMGIIGSHSKGWRIFFLCGWKLVILSMQCLIHLPSDPGEFKKYRSRVFQL